MKAKKTSTIKNCDKIILALVITVAILFCGLIWCGIHMKSGADKEYLSVYGHLMYRYPHLICQESTEDTNYVCEMTQYGVSQDGNPYVSYTVQAYDATTHQPKGEAENLTLYFQKRSDAIKGYAEALNK